MISSCFVRVASVGLVLWTTASCSADESITSDSIIAAVRRVTPLLQEMAAGSADQRKCFTCHGQAMAVLVAAQSARRGLPWDVAGVRRQVEHTYEHLKRGKKSYEEGKGQGGRVDMAGYALWTLEDGSRAADELTDTIVGYIFAEQKKDGRWNRTSNRPPSEASNFTTTYLALRAINVFARGAQQQDAERALERAMKWLVATEPRDTEDRVFQLLSYDYVDVDDSIREAAIDALTHLQGDDGGWAQTAEMKSDAYATGTVLYALHRSGVATGSDHYQRGVRFLLEEQMKDGSWHVASRSKPFQKYFETGFPHGKDQFISATASAWATIAILPVLPERSGRHFEEQESGTE